MSKVIVITADNNIRTEDFPTGSVSEELDAFYRMIGGDCRMVQHLRPKRLYSELGAPNSYKEGTAMLVDEEFLLHDKPPEVNLVGSYLYESDKHGHPILGTIIIIGETEGEDGGCFCGLSDETYNKLLPKFEELCARGRQIKIEEQLKKGAKV